MSGMLVSPPQFCVDPVVVKVVEDTVSFLVDNIKVSSDAARLMYRFATCAHP
jgi:hypothetical protein